MIIFKVSSIKERYGSMENKECRIESKVYAPDSELCDEAICYICKDGVWQELRTLDLSAVRPGRKTEI